MRIHNEKTRLKAIGQAIRLARKRKNLTGKELAESIGVMHPVICAIETGKSFPGGRMIIALCGVLGCTADEILCLTPPPDKTPDEEMVEALVGMISVLPETLRDKITAKIQR